MSNDLAVQINDTLSVVEVGFSSTIAQYQWDLIPQSQLQAAKQILTKSDYMMKIAAADPVAVQDALMSSAVLGLDLTPGKNQGWLLPRKSQKKDDRGNYITNIQLQVGYKGVEAIHQRMGVIDRLVIRVVRGNDDFEWSGDDQEKPKHEAKPNWFASDEERGDIVGAFAITYFPDQSIQVVVTSASEIFEKHRDISDAWKSHQKKVAEGKYSHPPPWVTFEKAMVEKTMAYIASKQWPANIRDQGASGKILETLHAVDTADYSLFKKPYSDKQWDIYQSYLHNDDDLGYHLFARYMYGQGIEIWIALNGDHMKTIPKGKKGVPGKGAERERLERKTIVGEEIFEAIKEGLVIGDSGAVMENIEDCSETTMYFLKQSLTENKTEALESIMAETNGS